MTYVVDAVVIVLAMMAAVAMLVGATQLRAILEMLEAMNNALERIAVELRKRK